MKKTLLGLLFAAMLISFMIMPPLKGLKDRSDDLIKFSPNDTLMDLRVKIQEMRQQIRRNGDTYDVDINPAMQYPLEELCGLKEEMAPFDVPVMELGTRSVSDSVVLPSSYTGYFTPVKNQLNCGSCWDFSTTGNVEGVFLKRTGKTYDFSEQYVLDCNTNGYDCGGGWFVFNMFCTPYGGRSEWLYPYKGIKGTCNTNSPEIGRINGYAQICGSAVCDPTSIKSAIYKYGTVSAAVYADYYFQAYRGGCFSGTASSYVNHAIVLCGWNDNAACGGAWYLKNSWSIYWGEKGFMWIKYGSQKVGYRTTYAFF
ncbi:MAG: C1 family peptidase [Candidatus Omnitrophota bacterium]